MSGTVRGDLRTEARVGARVNNLVTGVVLVGVLTFTAILTLAAIRANAEQTSTQRSVLADSISVAIEDRFASYNEVLFGVRSAFTLDGDLPRREYHELLSELSVDERLPGVQVIGAAHLVDAAEHEAVERRVDELAGASGLAYPRFEIYPEPTVGEVLPIDYIEPQQGNERAFGLDFLSEPNRRDAAARARDSGLPAATAPITLVQETATQRAILVMLPIYQDGWAVETVEERRDAFVGVVYAAFRMGDLVEGVLGREGPDRVAVYDVESEEILYDRDDAVARTDAAGENCPPFCGLPGTGDDRVVDLQVAGRTWRLFAESYDPVLSPIERGVPVATLFGGLVLAALVVSIVRSMQRSRQQALALAADTSNELEALSESADEAIVSMDDAGVIVAWNRAASRIFATSKEAQIGLSVVGARSAQQPGTFAAVLLDALENGYDPAEFPKIAMAHRYDDRSEFPVEVTLSQWSANGRTYITGFARDVTERLAAERQIVQTRNLLRGVLDAATGVAIIGTDVDGRIDVFNRGAEQMLGYRATEMVDGQTPALFHDPVEVIGRAAELGIEPGFEVFVSIARLTGHETRQWTYITAEGDRVPVELTVTPRYDGDQQLCGFIGVATDIRERLAAEERQQDLLDREREMVARLTELDRVKNDFVSTISHELRTPLTSIIGYAELLADDGADEIPTRHLDMIGTVTRNAQRLLLLVEDLLALSRIESGELHAARRPCDVGGILEAVQIAIAPIAADREIDITYDVDPTPLINGDAPRLERVFLNLLTNAVKFSERGSTVEVKVSSEPHDVVVEVSDHGIGIPADEIEHLFTRFFRSRNAERNAIQGTGLGLTIVSNIVERHGGRIDVQSVEGEGTTMTVRFPIDELERASSGLAAASV